MEIKWVKLSVGIFDDDYIKLMLKMDEGYELFTFFIRLLTVAGKNNKKGWINNKKNSKYSLEELETLFDFSPEKIEKFLKIFEEKFDFISQKSKGIFIKKWDKWQNIEGMEKVKTQTRERVKKHRNKKKCNATVTLQETLRNGTEEEEERREKKEEILTTTTTPENLNLNEDLKHLEEKNPFGEYSNVYLSDVELKSFECYKSIGKKKASELIDALSYSIETGKENEHIRSGQGHFAKLKAYCDYELKNPNKFRSGNNKEGYKNKDKEKEKEKEKDTDQETKFKKDPFLSEEVEKTFKIYEKECPHLVKLSFERKNREIRYLIVDFLEEINDNFDYFAEVCKLANALKEIVDKKIDLKMLIKNHIGIKNGKYDAKKSGVDLSKINFN